MKIIKVHSLGNDFLVARQEDIPSRDLSEFARKISDRHTGVGADGLLVISIKDKAQGRVGFRVFNQDGGEAEISGNGLRCAAASLYHDKAIDVPFITFETVAGERGCRLLGRKNQEFQFSLDMGVPRFSSDAIPFDDGKFHEKIVDYPLNIQQRTLSVTCVNVGNPHCCVFEEGFFPARILWTQIGQEIESHPFFPKRTNIEFIRVINRKEIEVLFWERGVGETLSSGSGSSAAAVASILKGLTDHEVKVRTSMGNIMVEWDGGKVTQAGPAEVVFEGSFLL